MDKVWVRTWLAGLVGVLGFCLGLSLHVVVFPPRGPGNAVIELDKLVLSNIIGSMPFLAVALTATMVLWAKRGRPFFPAWVLPLSLGLMVAVMVVFQAFSNPGPIGTWAQVQLVPLHVVRPMTAGVLGGTAMQLVQWRPA